MGSDQIRRHPKHSLFHRIAVSDDATLKNRRRTWNSRQGCRQSTTGAGLRHRQRLVHLALAGPDGCEAWVQHFGERRGREAIQRMSVIRGLDRLRLHLLAQV